MNFLGDIERAIASNLYPLRVPIAIGLAIALVGLVLLARRRGWAGVARRHPGRTVAAAAVALAVGLPAAWYLGSPLFIRTTLAEPAPSVVAAVPTPTPGMTLLPVAPSRAPAVTAAPTPQPTVALAAERRGRFHGADDFHFGKGTARLIETSPGSFIVRFESFSVRNGPDLYVYLSPSAVGYADGAIELGTLRATDGDFNTAVPAGTDVSTMRSVVIWCRAFSVQFAHAELH